MKDEAWVRTRWMSVELKGSARRVSASRGRRRRRTAPTVLLIVLAVIVTQQPEAGADGLLARAVERERRFPGESEQPLVMQMTPISNQGPASGCEPWHGVVEVGSPATLPVAAAKLLVGDFATRPLGAGSFRAWRQGEPHASRRESITERDGLLILRTVTKRGVVEAAELSIRGDTYRVVGLTLVGHGCRVEVAPLATQGSRGLGWGP